MKNLLTLLCVFALTAVLAQEKLIEPGKTYEDISVSQKTDVNYTLRLDKDEVYRIVVVQQGVDVIVHLKDETEKLLVKRDSPNGEHGEEIIEYKAEIQGKHILSIKRLDDPNASQEGTVSFSYRHISKAELARREQIRKELEPENKKTVLTLDIDHFWEAYDNLKNCQSHDDSVNSFQRLYLDRATDGLIDFIASRNLTAERFAKTVGRFPKFYNSVRLNTYEAKRSAMIIEEVFRKFRKIYPAFKPVKVCFAIGALSSGGTVSSDFVLIGTEITASTKDCDLSEFNNNALLTALASEIHIVQRIKNVVSHECVHTQQKASYNTNAVKCDLLYATIMEGSCDFIGELISGSHINISVQQFGDLHEEELWLEFKRQLCDDNLSNWLYNYSTSTAERPADLGYYLGYKIAQEYYRNAPDKSQAIIDIIQMDNPLLFLEKSKYDQKSKKLKATE
jgi:hypothetical protein